MREIGLAFLLTLSLAAPAVVQAQEPVLYIERVTLQEAVERALSRNPGVAVAAAEVRRAAAVLRQVRAASLPTLTGNGIYTRLDDDRRLGEQVFIAANQLQANLSLTVPLLVPQRWALWAEANESGKIATLSAADVRRRVAIATAHAYLSVLAQQRVVELSQRACDTAAAHHEYSKKRLAGGVGSQLDEVRAGQEVRANQSRLETAHAALLKAQGALGALMGEDRPFDTGEEPELEVLPAAAQEAQVEGRADLVALRAQRLAAQHLVRNMWTFYMPYVTGVFMPMYQNPATLVVPALTWQAQLMLTVPLYDGGLRYGVARERAARVDQVAANLDGVLRQARIDLKIGSAALRRADRAVTEAKEAAALSHRAVGIAELSYKSGATTNLELIDAQRRARDADTAVALAEDDARRVRLDLLAASGRFP